MKATGHTQYEPPKPPYLLPATHVVSVRSATDIRGHGFHIDVSRMVHNETITTSFSYFFTVLLIFCPVLS